MLTAPTICSGWIATPVGDPDVRTQPASDAAKLDIGPKTDAGAPTTFAIVGDASPSAAPRSTGWYRVALPRPPQRLHRLGARSRRSPSPRRRSGSSSTSRPAPCGSSGTTTEVFTTESPSGPPRTPRRQNGSYVTELIANTNPTGSYGPFAFGLSLHSDTLSEFGTRRRPGGHPRHQPARPDRPGGLPRLRPAEQRRHPGAGRPRSSRSGVPVFIT